MHADHSVARRTDERNTRRWTKYCASLCSCLTGVAFGDATYRYHLMYWFQSVDNTLLYLKQTSMRSLETVAFPFLYHFVSCQSGSNQLFLCRVWSSVFLPLLLSTLQPPTEIKLKQTCGTQHHWAARLEQSMLGWSDTYSTVHLAVTAEWAGDRSDAVACNCCESDL